MKKWDGVQVDSQLSIVARGRDDTQTYVDAWEELARRWDAHTAMKEALTNLLDWYDMDEGDLRPLMNAARIILAEVDGKAVSE